VSDYRELRTLAPDVIILDIRLGTPEAGWEVLDLLKLDLVLTRTPIIVCSADLRALQERSTLLQAKGCHVLPNPFDLDDLLTLLAQLVGLPAA
jgi:CheY-like chemotaxis protein